MSTDPGDEPTADLGGVGRLEQVATGASDPDLTVVGEAALSSWAESARGPATAGELTGLSQALASFTAAAAAPTERSFVRPLVRAGVAAVAISALLGGTAAAAYTGALPGSLQQLAHTVIGAPVPAETSGHGSQGRAEQEPAFVAASEPAGAASSPAAPSPAASPSGSDQPGTTTGPSPVGTPPAGTVGRSALGLCRAWTASNGHPARRSVLVRALVPLAGGASGVPAYCAAQLATVRSGSGSTQGSAGAAGQRPGEHATTSTSKGKASAAKHKHSQRKSAKRHRSQSPAPATNSGHGSPPANDPSS